MLLMRKRQFLERRKKLPRGDGEVGGGREEVGFRSGSATKSKQSYTCTHCVSIQ